MKALALFATLSWTAFWLTPDQLGAWHFARGDYPAAAQSFRDPLWAGSAWYRAGDFEQAARAFAAADTAEAHFNQGNARVMLGKYTEAVGRYDLALERRPGWPQALENRAIAVARAAMVAREGGDLGDQRIGADEIVFDANRRNSGQQTTLTDETALSASEIQALWLRRVQTRPGDFLRAKFAQQQALRAAESVP